jgi:5-methylcytosine-specific restriction endonuclease McrA
MDLLGIIDELRRERDRVQEAIEALEAVSGKPLKRRGRVSMTVEERELVSARMKRYWQQRQGKELDSDHADANSRRNS